MSRKFLSIALTLLLSLPLNAWSASWMANTMAESTQAPALHHQVSVSHDMHAHDSAGQQAMMDSVSSHESAPSAHSHASDNCDEQCMNCVSHCFGSGIASEFSNVLNSAYHAPQTSAGLPLERAFLLYRPPIQQPIRIG
ncbi:MAG: hypothetical protein H7A07_07115 [Pseudomonadales bacterium]|nr:hypothetical protein [Pseudomonadales bacterium]